MGRFLFTFPPMGAMRGSIFPGLIDVEKFVEVTSS
jgi:hypothetical protein